jgi:predicted MPP superfamily phosphohydrolase
MPLNRRRFLKLLLGSGAALGLGCAGYGTLLEPRRVVVNRVRVAVRGLPRAFDGLTIAQLSDFHHSHIVSAAYLDHCMDLANELKPDLFAFTGDYLTFGWDFLWLEEPVMSDRRHAPELARAVAACMGRARARYGSFACLGNHDRWFDARFMTDVLRGAGIMVLRDGHTTVRINGEPLPVVGIDDPWSGWPDMRRAFAGVDAPFTLALTHRPYVFEHWTRPGACLFLAGHTHGGQIRLPWWGPLVVPSRCGRKYARGLFRRDDAQMYVNSGLGMIPPPVRFLCPPEIALLCLEAA